MDTTHRNDVRGRLSALASIVIVALTPAWAQAQIEEDAADPSRMDLAVWIAAGWSDNLRRQADAENGNYQSVGLFVDMARERDRLSIGLSSDFQFRQYSLDDLEDEEIGNIDAYAEIGIIPDRFTWDFYNSFGQGRTDPFAAVGPTNRQNINSFSTGPTITLPLGTRTELSLNGLYRDYRHEDTSQFNSKTTTVEASVLRQIGPVSRFGVLADNEEIEYRDIASNYTIRGAVLHYERLFATGDVIAEVGRNELVLGETTESGPRARLAWRRAVGVRSRLSISVSKEFTDAGAFFAFAATDGIVTDRGDVLLSPSPLEQARVELLYEYLSPKTDFSFGIANADERFESDPTLNNNSTTLRLRIRRLLTPRMSVIFDAEDVQRDFRASAGEEGDRFLTLALDVRVARRMSIQAGIATYDRQGAEFFDERRAEIRIRYEPLR